MKRKTICRFATNVPPKFHFFNLNQNIIIC